MRCRWLLRALEALLPDKRRSQPRPRRDKEYRVYEPAKAEWPFPFSLFQNLKIFYLIFAAVMLLGLVAGAVCATTTTAPVADDEDLAVITQTATAAATGTATAQPGGTVVPSGTAGVEETPEAAATAPPLTIDPARTYFATISTSKGDIRIELNAAAAPQTVNSFVHLARTGFYNGTTFHRVLPGFVAQGGDPTGTGAGGPGYTVPDEASGLTHEAGAIAMAKEFDPQTQQPVPNSAGSQFYLTMAPQPQLDGQYTVFGRVVSGLEVVQSLTPRNPAENPDVPGDTITSITIEEQ